jgi:hypothetical protein
LPAAINMTRQFLTGADINLHPVMHVGYDDDQTMASARMERALEGLRGYHREWDPEAKRFKDRPEHTWESDIADGIRTVACGFKPGRTGNLVGPDGRPLRRSPSGVRIADGAGE